MVIPVTHALLPSTFTRAHAHGGTRTHTNINTGTRSVVRPQRRGSVVGVACGGQVEWSR